MNAVPIMPVKADPPIARSTEGHRGDAPDASSKESPESFMSTLRKVNDEAPVREDREKHDAAGDAPVAEKTDLKPVEDGTPIPENIRIETGNLTPEAPLTTPREDGLKVLKACANEVTAPEMVKSIARVDLDRIASAGGDDTAPMAAKGHASAGMDNTLSADTTALTPTLSTPAPAAAAVPSASGPKIPNHGMAQTAMLKTQEPPAQAHPARSEIVPVSGSERPEEGDLQDGVIDLARPPKAAETAATTDRALSEDRMGGRDATATRPETLVQSNAIGPGKKNTGKAATPLPREPQATIETAPERSAQPTESQAEAKMNLNGTHAESAAEPKQMGRSDRFNPSARPDWLAPIDRGDQPPLNRVSPTAMMAKQEAPPPSEAFRENNIGQIVERVAVSVRGGQSEARIALKPDHLGSIRLQISTENNTVSIKIMTEFSMARDLLESHLPQLKTELQQQGLEVEKFDVTLAEDQHNLRRDGRRQQNASATRSNPGAPDDNGDPQTDEDTEHRTASRRSPSDGVDFFA